MDASSRALKDFPRRTRGRLRSSLLNVSAVHGTEGGRQLLQHRESMPIAY